MNFTSKLDKCTDFSCIFRLVKAAVEATIDRRRAGLSLGLADLPNHIGALHQVGSNFIIMNRKLLKGVAKRGKALTNAYTFHVLLHEYIHSLGYIDEQKTQMLTYGISANVLGSEHPATLIAKHGIGSVFSDMAFSSGETSRGIEIVRNFETENLRYIG